MKFSYNWLKELTNFKDSPEELADFLTLRAFEVESVEKRGGDFALDVKILPNRVPDASGHAGLAREIAALKNIELKTPDEKPTLAKSPVPDIQNYLTVEVQDQNDCRRYAARMIAGIKIAPSPRWLKDRLEICGVQPINNAVDAANYVMLETGQPLHIFDFDKLKSDDGNPKSKKIIVRLAKKGENILALDEKTHELGPDILVIADGKEPIAIAGIKGGADSGVSDETRTVVLESANFNPARIGKGSRLLNLKTDASYRFEHGLDPNLAEAALNRLATLITRLAKGEILEGMADAYPQKSAPQHLPLRIEYSNRLAGISFPSVMYETALKRLGFKYQKRRRGEYHVEIPTSRLDIEREEDVIEEVLRIWGYEKIQSVPPTVRLASAEQNDERSWERLIKNFLAGMGFTEVFRYVFTGEAELKTFGLDESRLLEVANPLTPDFRFLASSPLPSFIRTAKENEHHAKAIRIFGVAKSFSKENGGPVKNVRERKRLVLVWSEKTDGAEGIFFRLKGAVDELFESMGLAELWYDDAIDARLLAKNYSFFHPYRLAEIKIGDETLGIIGELHPAIRKTLKMKNSVAAAEIDAEKLIAAAEKETEYSPIPRFPAIIRDIAVVVPEDEKTDRVAGIIENAGGKLLADSDLFDYFQDAAMRKNGSKSLAFHLIFRSPERTLTDEEVDKIIKRAAKALEEKGWTVRK